MKKSIPPNNIRQRNALDAVAVSVLLPGLGQVYNGQVLKGFSVIITLTILLQLSFGYLLAHVNDELLTPVFFGLLAVALGIYVFVMIDAAFTAKRVKENFTPSFFNRWYGYVLIIALAMMLFSLNKAFIVNHWLQAFFVPGTTMEPTISSGNRILVNFVYYNSKPMENGDIVVFVSPNPHATGLAYIGRIVAQAGEVVPGENNFFIPEGFVYIMSDNKPSNIDNYGIMPRSYVVGKVTFRFWDTKQWRIGPL